MKYPNSDAWWWVLIEHDEPRRVLAFIEPSTAMATVRGIGEKLAASQGPNVIVDLGAWPRRSPRRGHDGMVVCGFEKAKLLGRSRPEGP